MVAGMYELVFHAGDYFREAGIELADPPFLDRVVIRFGIASPISTTTSRCCSRPTATARIGAADDRSGALLLGHEPRELRELDPNLTVLNWLREDAAPDRHQGRLRRGRLRRLHGGARRAGRRAPALPRGQRLHPVPAAARRQAADHGRASARPDGSLHPVQQAMVECHGSQCGFCTPGLRDVAVRALSRRTGAEPAADPRRASPAISAAAPGTGRSSTPRAACTSWARATSSRARGRDGRAAQALAGATGWRSPIDGKRYFAPRRLEDLAALCEQFPGACLLAGGTDVGLWVTSSTAIFDTLIYVGAVQELSGLEITDTHLEIGAAVTYTDAMDELGSRWPDFGELIRRLGSVQIQEFRDDRRQRRERLADRRLHAGADRARRRAGAAQGAARRVLPLEDFYLGYRQTALLRASSSS